MGNLLARSALLVTLLIGCSKNQVAVVTEPNQVDPAQVKSVLLSDSTAQAKTCESEVRASGGKVLYQNSLGVLFTDRNKSELELSSCTAQVSSNDAINVPKSSSLPLTDEGRADLPTLLRLIPAEEIGARTFVKENPTFDGRGVVIAVLDTGCELDHPMLSTTSTGAAKILDFEDFSMEGRVSLAPVTLDAGKFAGSDGKTYAAETIGTSEASFGLFLGSSLQYAAELAKNDKFVDVGVLVYKNASGELRGRIDTNHNQQFDDETELFDYKASRLFTKLGEKKSLTTSLTLSPDGKWANLNFDDGSHGTHVAGITAGNEPNGLKGVAPGVQVICGKIGDNRLAGGSTTTASMLLAIDYAVQSKAHVINLSYGIRGGGNLGKSTIDQYVDKVSREKGLIFSISAGNEGPGLLTIGVPAAADLAITNGAYVSKKTAQDNYGLVGVQDDTIWYFSSIGPRLDGGWKPTLLAPGSALSSVPMWNTKHGNFRGTSMASPQTTGGLALILSAAQQSKFLTDRASVTRAVYDSAVKIPNLALVEQGHGLMNVPGAVRELAKRATPPIEYSLSVNSATSPNGRGAGIYVRSGELPANPFTVAVTPNVTPEQLAQGGLLRTLRLVPSADWIKVPGTNSLWIEGSPKTFQVTLDGARLTTSGLYSELISAIDDVTGQVAFEVPVTVVVPVRLTTAGKYQYDQTSSIRVGQTLRHFIEVPAGATSLQVSLETDGPVVWAQLLDAEGRKVLELRDAETSIPLPPLSGNASIQSRSGVYELDVVAPPTNVQHASVRVRAKAFSLDASLSPSIEPGKLDLVILNNFDAVKVVPRVELRALQSKRTITVKGDGTKITVPLSEQDKKDYSQITLLVETAKKIYDQMTDYPFRVFNAKGEWVNAGGLELKSPIDITDLGDLPTGDINVEIAGAFTKVAPAQWTFDLTERRELKSPQTLSEGSRLLLEPGQSREVSLDLSKLIQPTSGDFKACPEVTLNDPNGRAIQTASLCDLQ